MPSAQTQAAPSARTRPGFRSGRPKRWWAAALTTVLLLGLASEAAALGRHPYPPGTRVQITGIVTDPDGLPMPDVSVVLEATQRKFDIRRMRKVQVEMQRVMAISDERGEYSIEWLWDGKFNHFELAAGVPVRSPEGQTLRVLERVVLNDRIDDGSPVVAAVVIQNARFVNSLRNFLASLDSDDQQQIHLEMGEPDKVERYEHPDRLEVAWWYFEEGKVYRFSNGDLERIEPFDPVKPFGEEKADEGTP